MSGIQLLHYFLHSNYITLYYKIQDVAIKGHQIPYS